MSLSPAESGGSVASTLAGPSKRQRQVSSDIECDPFLRVVANHRPGEHLAGQMYNDFCRQPSEATSEARFSHLITGARELLKRRANDDGSVVSFQKAVLEAVDALLATFQALTNGATLLSICEGSLIFHFRVPRDKAVHLLDRVRQRPARFVELHIRSMGFLITNQCETVRLDERTG